MYVFPHLFDNSKIMKTILDKTKPRYNERLFCLFLCPSLYRGSTTFFPHLKLYKKKKLLLLIQYKERET